MPNSRLIFTFVDGNKDRKAVSFYFTSSNGTRIGPNLCRFVSRERIAKGEIPILNGLSSSDINFLSGVNSATFYAYYLNQDYNNNLFTVSAAGNTVTVTALTSGSIFSSVFIDSSIGSVVTENEDTVEINKTQLSIQEFEYLQADDTPCGKFKLRLESDFNFDFYQINNSTFNNNPKDNILEIDLLRDVSYTVQLKRSVFQKPDVIARFPQLGRLIIPSLKEENFNIKSSSVIGSGTINITPNFTSLVTYQYSIDNGVTWVNNGVFTGLANGNYTILIRDKFINNLLGCQISKDFALGLEANKKPFISISKANSLYFAKQENTDNISKFQNDDNSFSSINKSTINYCNEALFELIDETRIQVKSSYDSLIVTLRSEEGNIYNLPFNQRTNNLGLFKSLDCVVEYYNATQSIIYFNSGNEYNEAGNIIGNYSLNGNLPDFAIVGETIELDNYGPLEIKDIIYLDSIDKRCIVVDIRSTGLIPQLLIVKALYNVLDYNIFDFDILWAFYSEGIYDVLIEFTDDNFDSEFYLSENINLKAEHEGSVHIRAFNTNNRDIFYKYDIYPTIRVNLFDKYYIIKDEIENNITDNSVEIVKSTVNEGTTFVFDELTREAGIKLALFLSCEFVFIDGIGYAKSDSLSFEPIEFTNMQSMTAQMLKTQINYNNLININTGIDFGVESVDVPNFIIQNTNFIKF